MRYFMKETMGQIIRRLRKERNLTQEELAEQLNISAQAVSKWESESSMPDISQVVPLANVFGVSTDVLFGMYGCNQAQDIDEKLSEIFRIYDACKDGEEGKTAAVILEKYRDLIRLYPNNSTILNNAMAFAEMVLDANENALCEVIGQNGIENLKNDLVKWAEIVIKYSSSANDILEAKIRMIGVETRRKNWEKAAAIIEDFPDSISKTKHIRLADLKYRAGDNDSEREYRCFSIRELIEELGQQVFTIGNLYMRQKKYKDALYCYSFMQNVLDALYGEEDYRPSFVYSVYPLYRFPAYCLLQLGNDDDAITMLEKGVEYLKAQAKSFNIKTTLNNPLLHDCTFSYGFEGNAQFDHLNERIKKLVCGDDFEKLRENSRYQRLLARLEKE